MEGILMNKLIIPVILSLTGCATVISGSSQSFTVTSNVPYTTYEITNKTGKLIDMGTTNDITKLSTGAGYFQGETYSIKFSKDGYHDSISTVDTHLNPWYFGNLILGGVIGGLIIDPLTGAMWKLPEKEMAVMRKK